MAFHIGQKDRAFPLQVTSDSVLVVTKFVTYYILYFRNILCKLRPWFRELKMAITETLTLLTWIRSFIEFYRCGEVKFASHFKDKLGESTPGAFYSQLSLTLL